MDELEGFTYATALDLNMDYTIRLDHDVYRIFTIIFPWGKYSYVNTIGGCGLSRHLSIKKVRAYGSTLEFVQTYLDNSLIITMASFDDHLKKLRIVLIKL